MSRRSPSWQQTLAKAREMRGQAGAALFDRLKLLVAVFEDADWRVRTGKTDESEWLKMLDTEVADVFLPFGVLRDMLAYAPERSQWSDGRLNELRAKMVEERRQARKEQKAQAAAAAPDETAISEKAPVRNYVTKADLAEVEKKKQDFEQKATYYEKENKTLQERYLELQSAYRNLENENRRLVRENARLEGMVCELQRMVARNFDGVPAGV